MRFLLSGIGCLLIAIGVYLACSVVDGVSVGKLTGKTSASVAVRATDPVTFWVFAAVYVLAAGLSVGTGWLLLRGERHKRD